MWAMLLTEIDHVAIAVLDLDAAIEYYEQMFGATVHHREIVDSDGVEEALLKVGDSYIQLAAATRRIRRSPGSSRSAAKGCTTSATGSMTSPPRCSR